MRQNIEIEFKTKLSESKYNELLKVFNLEDQIFTQINHYFDTLDNDLLNKKIVLRIRQKGNIYKLTSKMNNPNGNKENLETHIELKESDAINMLKNGFDASIINIPYKVFKVCELTTHRAKTQYLDGIVFLDKSEYNGITDYELEYEANSHDNALNNFNELLKSFNIEYEKSISKSKRCRMTKK
ncbi:MAG: CYTH domain-containing protein [Anaeroplasmataceae bacterium]